MSISELKTDVDVALERIGARAGRDEDVAIVVSELKKKKATLAAIRRLLADSSDQLWKLRLEEYRLSLEEREAARR